MGCKQAKKPEPKNEPQKLVFVKSHTMRKVEEKAAKTQTIVSDRDIILTITPDDYKQFDNLVVPANKTLREIGEIISQKIPKNLEYELLSNGKNIRDHTFEKQALYELLTANQDKFSFEINYFGLTNIPPNSKAVYIETNLIAKPLILPFCLIVYDKRTNNFKKEFFTEQVKNFPHLEGLDEFFTYCNGMDHIFIYHHDNKFNHIDLSTKRIYETETGLLTPRTAHAMIFIPNNYVFIVGGKETTKVEYFDIKKHEFFEHSELKEIRVDPSLALIDGFYLYAFSGYTKSKKALYNFERVNLRGKSKAWETLEFKLVEDFRRSLFAVSYHSKNEVIFVGGMYRNENGKTEYCDDIHVFDITDLSLMSAMSKGIKADFKEKFVLPMKEKMSLLFPYRDAENPDDVNIVTYNGSRFDIVKFDIESY
jgi:hypothetical protein